MPFRLATNDYVQVLMTKIVVYNAKRPSKKRMSIDLLSVEPALSAGDPVLVAGEWGRATVRLTLARGRALR